MPASQAGRRRFESGRPLSTENLPNPGLGIPVGVAPCGTEVRQTRTVINEGTLSGYPAEPARAGERPPRRPGRPFQRGEPIGAGGTGERSSRSIVIDLTAKFAGRVRRGMDVQIHLTVKKGVDGVVKCLQT